MGIRAGDCHRPCCFEVSCFHAEHHSRALLYAQGLFLGGYPTRSPPVCVDPTAS